MSVQMITRVLETPMTKALAKLAMIALANYADENGRCWPSRKRLIDDTGMDKRSLSRAFEWLEEHDLLRVEARHAKSGRQTSNLYILFPEAKQREGQIEVTTLGDSEEQFISQESLFGEGRKNVPEVEGKDAPPVNPSEEPGTQLSPPGSRAPTKRRPVIKSVAKRALILLRKRAHEAGTPVVIVWGKDMSLFNKLAASLSREELYALVIALVEVGYKDPRNRSQNLPPDPSVAFGYKSTILSSPEYKLVLDGNPHRYPPRPGVRAMMLEIEEEIDNA